MNNQIPNVDLEKMPLEKIILLASYLKEDSKIFKYVKNQKLPTDYFKVIKGVQNNLKNSGNNE